ncbi:MAG TPA: hypothetical protein VHL78_10090, partial [Actinomycetota bacterium]|nr:hypothetical protein [Actinomycetota bacterium]
MGRAIAAMAVFVLVGSGCRPQEPEGGGPGERSPAPAPRPMASPAPERRPPLGEIRVRRQLVAMLEQPLAMAIRAGDDALFVAERTGRVRAVRDGAVAPIIDLSS